MSKLVWLAWNLDDWYMGDSYVIEVDMEEIHWNPAYMPGITKAQWEAKRKELNQ